MRGLELTSVDFVMKNMLLPLIDRLSMEGFEVRIVCSSGKRARELKKTGYKIKMIEIPRRISIIPKYYFFN